jgi:hypothetical protein
MPRAARLFIMVSVTVVIAVLFLLALPIAAQTETSTPNHDEIDLTLSSMAIALTKSQQTVEFLEPTRTAVAVTRDPSLLTPASATTFELTATQAWANSTATKLAYTPSGAGTPPTGHLTAVKFFDELTQTTEAITREPSLALTIYPTGTPGPCEFTIYYFYLNDFAAEVEASLNAAGFVDVYAGGFNTGVIEGERGCTTEYPLEIQITLSIEIDNSSRETIADATVNILAVLSKFPRQDTFGSKKARLMIVYKNSDQDSIGAIDTGYNNALDAYSDGLRGDDLLLALGEIVPVTTLIRLY